MRLTPLPAGRRRTLFTVLRHGSEDVVTPSGRTPSTPAQYEGPPAATEGTETLTTRHSRSPGATPEAEGDADDATAVQGTWQTTAPALWDNATLVAYLESRRCPAKGVEMVISEGSVFLAIVQDEQGLKTLADEFGIISRASRVALTAQIKELSQTKPAPQHSGSSAGVDDKGGSRVITGEKSLKIPSIPKAVTGQALCTAADWKIFMGDLQGWAELGSEDYGYLVQQVYTDPMVDICAVFQQLTAEEQRMDSVLGVHLRTEATMETKRLFTKDSDYKVQDRVSGLQMLSFLGKKINKKCASRFLSLSNELTDRKPLLSAMDLSKELREISRLTDDLMHQGQPVEDITIYRVLRKAISELLLVPELAVPLTYPVCEVEKAHGMSGADLQEALQDIDYNLKTNPDYKRFLTVKVPKLQSGPAPTAAGARQITLPKDHKQQKPGLSCLNERDLGKCKMQGKGCKGEHGSAEFTQKECTHPCYVKHKVCPNFAHRQGKTVCLDKHERLPFAEMRDRFKAARAEFEGEFGGVELNMVCSASGMDEVNILPTGTRRNRRRPQRMIDTEVQALFQEEAEYNELQTANPDSDPEVTDADDSGVLEESMADSFVEPSSESDQSGDWVPPAEDSTESEIDDIIPRELQHLLEKGYSTEELMNLTLQMETMAELATISCANIPESVRMLIDGGTFKHMFGTGITHLLSNRRKVEPIPVSTAGGIKWMDEMADLHVGSYQMLNGYVNPYMATTLLSEGVLHAEENWHFYTGETKCCFTPEGNFTAEQHGTLHYWPTTMSQGVMQLDAEPHFSHPVPHGDQR